MHSVLLVDDEIYARQGLRQLIDWAGCGYEVLDEADNGEDALDLIQQRKPDLVITDIRMPVVDGLELIRQARESLIVDTCFIIISGYNDFVYAQQAVRFGVHDFILKPIDEQLLSHSLSKLNEKLIQGKDFRQQREQQMNAEMLQSLIKGEADAKSIAEWTARLNMTDAGDIYYLFIEINDVHPWSRHPSTFSLEQWKEQVKKEIQDMLGIRSTILMNLHRNRLGIVLSSRDLGCFQGSIDRFAAELQLRLKLKYREAIYIYVGHPVREWSQLKESYLTAKEALQHKFAANETKIVVYERVKDQAIRLIGMEQELYEQLLEQFEENYESGILSSIDLLFEQFTTKRFAPEAVKMAIQQCVSGMLGMMKKFDIAENELQSLEPIVGWNDLNLTLNELKRLFTSFTMEGAQVLGERRKQYVRGGIQNIKNYIETHFRENISLKSIAAQFYMNSVYLGQLFKKTYGLYFNEFLLQLRVQEAKKLLRQTDLRVYEVAEKVGFSNADYFVTQFEKQEGMTPTEYRNKLFHS
ncbi:response regulator [Marinicrinis lubricantis]|uniref:Response regulator n=1 Tax=Marinicrinis lubricantis TaxID=2086470 RepID=A0ABW1INW2_9BACL